MTDVLDPFEPLTTNGNAELFEVFTAGAMLWKLLLIRSLFNDYGNQKSLNLVLHSNVLSAEYNERLILCVPKPIVTIIRRATQSNRGLRYQSLQEMLSTIEVLPPELLASDTQVRTWVESIAGDFFSGLQHSSGIRRIALGVQSPSQAGAAPQRISHIDTLLSGFRAPVAARVPQFTPNPSGHSHGKTTAATTQLDNRPTIAATSGSIEPFGPKRRVRTAYVIGTFMGLGLSLGLSVLGTQFNTRPTSAASTLTPGQISTIPQLAASVARDVPALSAAAEQDSGIAHPTEGSVANANASQQAKLSATQGVRCDHSSVNPIGPKRSSNRASNAAVPPSSSNRNRWGI